MWLLAILYLMWIVWKSKIEVDLRERESICNLQIMVLHILYSWLPQQLGIPLEVTFSDYIICCISWVLFLDLDIMIGSFMFKCGILLMPFLNGLPSV